MRACRLSYSRASTAVMPTKTASARAFACCLESAESSAERFFVNVATVSLHSRNRPSPIFGGGQLRKLRKIIRSPKRVWVPCQICRVPDGTAGRRGRGDSDAVRVTVDANVLPYWFKQLQGMKF